MSFQISASAGSVGRSCAALLRASLPKIVVLIAMIAASAIASLAQNANVYGQLGNFDVINHTGHETHGFEIELEGIQIQHVFYAFSVQRYGAPRITATPTGVLVRWESAYSGGQFAQTTIPYGSGTNFGGSCYQWGTNYDNSGCEHFGVSLNSTPSHTQYRWLVEDVNNPGTLVGVNPPLAIVSPVYTIQPPAREGEGPVLEAEIEAPEPAEAPELYGDAQWVKVYKVQLNREVNLDELVSDNAIVPQDASQVETEWEIVQAEPASNSNGNRRQRRSHGGPLNFDTRSVVRRFEVYEFTGAYDPVTHEAICADLTCSAPADDEVGLFLSAQMAAANVNVFSVSVAKNGSGTVGTADRAIDCGSTCRSLFNENEAVTLTATPAKDFIFTGWNGDCSGNLLSCVVNASSAMNVTANFSQMFTIHAKTSGKGLVTSAAGINCGKTCSAKVVRGTSVTLTAAPESGFRFANWSGACSGSNATCTVTVNAATQVQANFVK